ncbi:MAG: hypothetical protein V7752_14440 [Halopseudomonas sp.]
MRYSPLIIGVILAQFLTATSLQAATLKAGGNLEPLSIQQMSKLDMAAYLLEKDPQNQNDLAIEQARELVAGRPGKEWKNCILEKEVGKIKQDRVKQDTNALNGMD